MENTMITEEVLEASPSGISAWFIDTGKKMGLKVFKYGYERDESYKRQKLASELGLGPEVGECGEVTINDLKYATMECEVVETIGYLDEDHYAQFKPEYDFTYDDLYTLAKEIREKVYDFCDVHPCNFGLKKGKLVLIDFG